MSVFLIVLPVFALIAAGWVARRSGALGPSASAELNRFVVYLALPALLFEVVATAQPAQLWQPGFIASFGIAAASVFVATLAWRLRGRHLADAAVDGLNAAYANTGFMGFPLAAAVLGADALAPTLIATIVTVCVLFAVALVLIEAGLQTERHPRRLLFKVLRTLVRNPLLVAPTLGALVLLAGVQLPSPVRGFLELLGAAAAPCALIVLGLFLAEKRASPSVQASAAAGLVAAKLVVQPALTWVLATQVFHLPTMLTHCAVLMAALPTGTGPFMVAEFHRREAALTARVVLVSTVLSVITVSVYLTWALPHGGA